MHPPSRFTHYIFAGRINDLEEYEKLASKSLYFRDYIPISTADNQQPKLRDVYFLLASDKPFEADETFEVHYYKDGSNTRERFAIDFDMKREAHYRIDYDKESDKHVMKLVDATETSDTNVLPLSTFFPAAQAEEGGVGVAGMSEQVEEQVFRSVASLSENDVAKSAIIGQLQNDRTTVGRKIDLMGVLQGEDPKVIADYLMYATDREPMIVTIWDLSRHTDPQLAAKSRSLIENFDVENYVRAELKSEDETRTERAAILLSRLEPGLASRLLEKANIGDFPAKEVPPHRQLVPTGTGYGDRYYFVTELKSGEFEGGWAGDVLGFTDCWKKVYSEEMEWRVQQGVNQGMMQIVGETGLENAVDVANWAERSIGDVWNEIVAVSGKYKWRDSKEEALKVVDQIERCGGEAHFVDGKNLSTPQYWELTW